MHEILEEESNLKAVLDAPADKFSGVVAELIRKGSDMLERRISSDVVRSRSPNNRRGISFSNDINSEHKRLMAVLGSLKRSALLVERGEMKNAEAVRISGWLEPQQ